MGGNIGGTAKQDGHRPEDLYSVTVERIYELLNQTLPEKEGQNFYGAFQTVMDNLDDIYDEQFPEEVVPAAPVADTLRAAGVEVPATAVATTEAEFVPRDPEELTAPKKPTNEKAKTGKAKAK